MSRRQAAAEVYVYEPYCKGCDICVDLCPKDVFKMSSRLGGTGYFVVDVVAEELCNGCRICELACPDLAITIVKKKRRE